MHNGNCPILDLVVWQNWCFGQFHHSKMKSKHFCLSFSLVKGLFEGTRENISQKFRVIKRKNPAEQKLKVFVAMEKIQKGNRSRTQYSSLTLVNSSSQIFLCLFNQRYSENSYLVPALHHTLSQTIFNHQFNNWWWPWGKITANNSSKKWIKQIFIG